MINELKSLLPYVPDFLKKEEQWGSLLINKYPPVIHRLSFKISETRTLLLHKLFNTKDEKALMHSHSWPFALKLLKGEYEMGVGFSKNREEVPKSIFTSFVKTGDFYEMLTPDIWHYTKPTKETDFSCSVMLIGERSRERKAENNLPLSLAQKKEMFDWFKKHNW